jgi:hypothetical protein
VGGLQRGASGDAPGRGRSWSLLVGRGGVRLGAGAHPRAAAGGEGRRGGALPPTRRLVGAAREDLQEVLRHRQDHRAGREYQAPRDQQQLAVRLVHATHDMINRTYPVQLLLP